MQARNSESTLARAGSTPAPHLAINELEFLHAGLGVLMARYLMAAEPCLALWVSRQLRLIANHPELPDPGSRPLYMTMAARWHVRATLSLPGHIGVKTKDWCITETEGGSYA
jgi:hypothetical protein